MQYADNRQYHGTDASVTVTVSTKWHLGDGLSRGSGQAL